VRRGSAREHHGVVQSVYDAAGGMDGLLALAHAWHARVLDHFAWATTTTMARYHRSADDVPDGLSVPHWSWEGLAGPTS